MVNRYANLSGPNKIKDEFTKINTGFDKVQEEMDAEVAAREFLEDRVDTIIQGGGPDKDAELVDIRTPDPAYTPERTISVAGDITRDLQAQFVKYTGRVFNVKGFGAKGDGVTDDTAAIQAAIDAIQTAGGGVLFFPSGQYVVSSELSIPFGNIKIIGYNAKILTKVGALVNTFKIYGTKETGVSIVNDIAAESKVFNVGENASLFSVGDYVKISTNENYFVTDGRDYKKGELVKVKSVDTGTGDITIEGNGFALSYTAAGNNLIAEKINFIENVYVEGIEIEGTGTNNDQHGILAQFAQNVEIKNCILHDLEVGIAVDNCLHSSINHNFVYRINKVGTGYGVIVSGTSKDIEITHNRFEDNRHSFTTGGYDGVAMNILVAENIVDNHMVGAALDTHGNARYVSFKNNQIYNALIGIQVRNPFTEIIGNTIIHTTQSAIYTVESGGINIVVRDNTIEKAAFDFFSGISITPTATSYEANHYVIITSNVLNQIQNGTAIDVKSFDPVMVKISNNDVKNAGSIGIRVISGEQIIITNNQLKTSIRAGTANMWGIQVEASDATVYGSTVIIADNNVYQFNTGIKVMEVGGGNVDKAQITGNIVNVVSTKYSVNASSLREGQNNPEMFTGTITWNPASLADGAGETSPNITVTGAALGDYVQVSAPYNLQGILAYGYVSAADTVNIRIQNETGGTIDLGSGNWKVVVRKS